MLEYKLIDCSAFTEKTVFEAKLSSICEERKNRISRLKNEKAMAESLGASIALEELLGACGINGPFNFTYGKTGKPYLTNTFSDGRSCYISLTHKFPMAGAVVSDVPVGIDIEKIGKYRESIPKRCFTEKDCDFIAAATDEKERQLRFYKVWTFKEAYCKAKDISLAENMSTVDYDENLVSHFTYGDFLVSISVL